MNNDGASDVFFSYILIGTFNQCDVPKNLFTKSFTALSFKLTKPPTFFGQGILWYRPNERKNSRSHIRIWTCSCNTTRFWNPYPSNPNVREMNKTLDGCQLLSQHDWDKKDGTATPIRKGWSHVHLTDNWTSVISNLTDSEFRVLFVLDGKVRIGANKRPFLVLDGITEVPNKSQRDAVHHSRNDCLLPQVETQNCCRANYWIDVEKLGWSDWILSPKGFYFHHCVGNCNGGFNHINNNSLLEYSDVLNAYMKRIKFNIRPCCVPKTLSHLPIVITTDGQTINRTYVPHFVVENCSCFGFSKYD